MSSYYDVLEVLQDANQKEIRDAYRRLALQWHPDKNLENKEEAEENFKKIGMAYSILSDKNKRAEYDKSLKQGEPFHTYTGPGIEEFYRMFYELLEKIKQEIEEIIEEVNERGEKFAEEAGKGYWNNLQFFIEENCNLNKKYEGNTVIHYAVIQNNLEALESILTLQSSLVPAWRADLELENNDCETPLHIATRLGNKEAIILLSNHHVVEDTVANRLVLVQNALDSLRNDIEKNDRALLSSKEDTCRKRESEQVGTFQNVLNVGNAMSNLEITVASDLKEEPRIHKKTKIVISKAQNQYGI